MQRGSKIKVYENYKTFNYDRGHNKITVSFVKLNESKTKERRRVLQQYIVQYYNTILYYLTYDVHQFSVILYIGNYMYIYGACYYDIVCVQRMCVHILSVYTVR